MKLRFRLLIAALAGVSVLAACNSLEVTMPVGPQGERGLPGEDGLSAYEVWVKAVQDKTIDYSGPVDIAHYFLYLKGKDGSDGKDGADGKSAYELWKEYVASGVEDPHNPDSLWDKSRISMADFYRFLTGNNGVDGLSAYELWKDYVVSTIASGGVVADQSGNIVTLSDLSILRFFQYLTGQSGSKGDNGIPGVPGEDGQDGKDGVDGKDGEDGKDGVDGKDGKDGKDGIDGRDGSAGKSAYELWVADVTSPTGLEDPKNPGSKWDPDRTSIADFYDYLRGADGTNGNDGNDGNDGVDGKDGKDGIDGKDGKDGKDGSSGKSAYELWKELVLSASGLDNPGNGVYDVTEFPKWPTTAVSIEDFFRYLRGCDGNDGEPGVSSLAADSLYVEEADWSKYNVVPVRALAKVKEDGAVKDTTYEYVNPYTGGCTLLVTGPGPVAIPDCKVVFKDQAGNSYTRTSDASGYIYLLRDELPDWSGGSPSVSDLSARTRPESFEFSGKTIDDASRIAATCGIPYKVDVLVNMTGAEWSANKVYAYYETIRSVEGTEEKSWGGHEFPNGSGETGLGYFFYRSKCDMSGYRELDFYGSAPALDDVAVGDHFLTFNGFFAESSWTRSVGTVPSTQTKSVVFGDGASPAMVDVHYLPTTETSNGYYHRGHLPDYGLKKASASKTIIPEYCMIGGLDVTGLKGGTGDKQYTSYNDKLVLGDDGATKIPVNRTNYELLLGKTSFSFSLDYSSFGHVYLKKAYYDAGTATYRFKRYGTFMEYLTGQSVTDSDAYVMSLRNSGYLDGSRINTTVYIHLAASGGVISTTKFSSFLIRNVYDGFNLEFSPFTFHDAYYGSVSGTFSYDVSSPYTASCTINGRKYTFQAIKDAVSAPLP